MTHHILRAVFLFSLATLSATVLATLSGCGSLLATMDVGAIDENPGHRTLGRMIEDNNIETKATVNIHAADAAFHEAHIAVVSYNGYVLVAGQVNNEALKTKATKVVRDVRGVRRIYNELDIAAPSSAITRTADAWVTAKLKSALLSSTDIEGNRVKVITENGVVFLLGLASQAEADRISETASGVAGVQRVVRLFELL